MLSLSPYEATRRKRPGFHGEQTELERQRLRDGWRRKLRQCRGGPGRGAGEHCAAA